MREFMTVSGTATVDLSSHQYKAVQIDGPLATENLDAIGILQNKPDAAGREMTIAYFGEVRAIAGAAINQGARLKVQSGGWLITATSGTGAVGTALIAAASGDTFKALVNFTTAADAFGA